MRNEALIRNPIAIVFLGCITIAPAFGQPIVGAEKNPKLPKALNVLLVGNSQCPTIVRNRLLETLAASDKEQRPIKALAASKGARRCGRTGKPAQVQRQRAG